MKIANGHIVFDFEHLSTTRSVIKLSIKTRAPNQNAHRKLLNSHTNSIFPLVESGLLTLSSQIPLLVQEFVL